MARRQGEHLWRRYSATLVIRIKTHEVVGYVFGGTRFRWWRCARCHVFAMKTIARPNMTVWPLVPRLRERYSVYFHLPSREEHAPGTLVPGGQRLTRVRDGHRKTCEELMVEATHDD